MKKLTKLVLVVVSGMAVAYGVARSTPHWFAPRQVAEVDIHDRALIQRGEYLSR